MKPNNFYTVSIEEALTPFIRQVESLINLRQINAFRPLSQYSLCKACENVNVAVMGFIATAENIAANYPQISSEIRTACNWSRSLVTKILDTKLYQNNKDQSSSHQLVPSHNNKLQLSSGPIKSLTTDQSQSNATFGQWAEGLMTGIERILLLADWLSVIEVRRSIVKVILSLSDLDSRGTENFPNFMHMFSRFGADMVELGELSGQRQMDLKNTQLRCLVALVRSMLERTTMMILAVWKINFRHDTRLSRGLRSLTFQYTNYLLDLLMAFLVVSHPLYNEMSKELRSQHSNSALDYAQHRSKSSELLLGAAQSSNHNVIQSSSNSTSAAITAAEDLEFLEKESQNLYEKIISSSQQTFLWELLKKLQKLVSKSIKEPAETDEYIESDFQSKSDLAVNLVSDLLNCAQYFTQCSFVSLSERQHVISLCRRLRVQLRSCLDCNKEPNQQTAQVNCPDDDRGDQARLFVDDLCDQILTAVFNITIKYGDEIINNSINITEALELPTHSNTNSLGKRTQIGLNSGFNTTSSSVDDRKPPRPGANNSKTSSSNNNSNDLFDESNNKLNSGLSEYGSNSEDKQMQDMPSLNIGIIKLKMITMCNFLAQISMSKEISLVCLLTRDFIETLSQMITLSTEIFQEISTSKHAKDCTDVLIDIWSTVISDVANIKADIVEWRNNRYSIDHYPTYPSNNSNSEFESGFMSENIMRNYRQQMPNLKSPPFSPSSSLLSNPTISPSNSLINPSSSRYNTPVSFIQPSPVPIGPLRMLGTPTHQSPSKLTAGIYQTNSVSSLDKEKLSMSPAILSESPNPWLSVAEIEKIIAMKGRVVTDLSTQITMFSHNEGPLKTSSDLLNTVHQLVREMANFHGFAERNVINERILPDLDKFPSLISRIFSVMNQPVKSRMEIFTKIDKLVELVRYTASLVTNITTIWRNQSVQINKPLRSKSFNTRNNVSTPPTTNNKTRFVYDEIPDNKSCFSDTILAGNNLIYGNKYYSAPRSSSLGRPDI